MTTASHTKWRPFLATTLERGAYGGRVAGLVLFGYVAYGLVINDRTVAVIMFNQAVGFWLDDTPGDPPLGMERPYMVTYAIYFTAGWLATAGLSAYTLFKFLDLVIYMLIKTLEGLKWV